ncbi:MAG TPA: preprotein translocase subunit YajC [Candidatus Kapabacteria bacterium]|jgi:preprotein translocase subunit YajC
MTTLSSFALHHWQLLMTPPSGGAGQDVNPIVQFLPIIVIGFIFYFLIYRPQKKRQKAREQLVSQVEKGDKVITASGIHGTVAQVEETTVLLQVSDNTKIRIEKTALGNVTPKNAEKAA